MESLKVGDRVRIKNKRDHKHIIKEFNDKKPSVLITYDKDTTWWPIAELYKIDNQLDFFEKVKS